MPGHQTLVLAVSSAHRVVVLAAWNDQRSQWGIPEWIDDGKDGWRPKHFFSHWMSIPELPAA
jgi:hypothetical protein